MDLITDPGTGWMADGLCVGLPADYWSPTAQDIAKSRYARKICEQCPVREPCLSYAVYHHIAWGIWGGLTGAARSKLTLLSPWYGRPIRSDPPSCGTTAGYRWHYRHHQKACTACRVAQLAYRQRRRAGLRGQ